MLDAMSVLAVRSLAIAVALAAGAALFVETRHYGLLGFDTLPLIASSRVESLADVLGLFRERLMDGRYPSAFHRPLVSASFALDEAVWGLDPFGYQLTGALWFTALLLGLVSLGGLLGKQTGPGPPPDRGGRRWLAVALPALVALHPAAYEVVPIPARRADLMCAVFATAAVVFALRRRAWVAGVAALLAILSKESGYAVPPLVAATALLLEGQDGLEGSPRSSLTGLAARLRAALELAAPAFGLAAFALAGRLLVLGGMGGHRDEFGVIGALASAPGIAVDVLSGIVLFGSAAVPLAVYALGAALLLAVVGLAGTLGVASSEDRCVGLRPIGLGILWSLGFAATYAAAGWVGAWYFLLPEIGAAIALLGLLAAAIEGVRCRAAPRAARGCCVLAAGLLAGVLVWQASFAPVLGNYGEWQRATAVSDEFFRKLDQKVSASSAGQRIDAPPLPMWASPSEGVPGVQGAAILSDYSVQAWADLMYPQRSIRVLGVPEGVLPRLPLEPAPNELVIRIRRRRVGY